METDRFIELCIDAVVCYFNDQADSTDKNGRITPDDVFVVWCCKTLQNNKALQKKVPVLCTLGGKYKFFVFLTRLLPNRVLVDLVGQIYAK